MRGQRGFSLVEILIVVLIVGFMVLVVSNIPNSISLIGKSQYSSVAKDIASQIIEDARSTGYDNLANGTTTVSDYRLASLPSGQASRTVIDCPSTICKNGEIIKQVTATITWKEPKATQKVSVTTLISQGGLK